MDIGIIIGIIGIIVGAIISIAIFQISNRKQQKDKSESSPKVKLFIFENELKENVNYDLIYFVDLKQFNKKNVMLYYHFPMSIGNIGNVSLEDIQISLKFGAKSPLPIADEWVKSNSPMPNNFITRKHIKQDRVTTITNSIQHIHPKIRLDIGEIFKLTETKLEFTHKLPNNEKVNIEANFSHKIDLLLEAKNIIPKKYTFNLSLINLKDKSDCANHLNSEYQKLSPIEKYNYCKDKKIFFVFPKTKELDTKNEITLNCGKVYPENIHFYDIEPKTITKHNKK